MTHDALMHCLHLSLFLATVSALAQLFIPSLSFSISTVLLQVVSGCTTLRFRSGCRVNAVVQTLLLSMAYPSPSFLDNTCFRGFSSINYQLVNKLHNRYQQSTGIIHF
jgi:hypothetical protein